MPGFPKFSRRLDQLTGSVFEKFLPKMHEKGKELVRLHIGDSYLPPTYSLPIAKDFIEKYPYFNRYANTLGVQELREALAEKVTSDNHLPVGPEELMPTSGACSALNITALALIEPGEEVLVLTPAWPFFFGMVKMAGGIPVEVPFYTLLYENAGLDIEDYLSLFITSQTAALYLNTPNNPSGKVLSREQLAQVAMVAKKHHLWLISDEAYDGMTYDGHEHISVATFPEMFPQTLSIFTFSKMFMFAGLRLGYLAAEQSILKNLNKMMVHQYYSPSTLGQYMMVEPVKKRHEWGARFVEECRNLRDLFTENLHIPHHAPEGTYFLFFSIKDFLRGKDYWQIINECLDIGVSVAPGSDFGKDFSEYIRLCFAGESPERLEIATERLNRVFLA
jgi:aspartate/methionine/tyrosine aminotransferase